MALSTTRTIGDAQVSVLTDGVFAFPPDLFPGTDPARLRRPGRRTAPTACGCWTWPAPTG